MFSARIHIHQIAFVVSESRDWVSFSGELQSLASHPIRPATSYQKLSSRMGVGGCNGLFSQTPLVITPDTASVN